MALDNRPLTALGASEQAASLASLPEDLWRKIASLARPPTVRALVAACPDASLRQVLRTDIDRAERAAFGLTQREAERLLVDPLRRARLGHRDGRRGHCGPGPGDTQGHPRLDRGVRRRKDRARNPHPVWGQRDSRERPGALELPGHRRLLSRRCVAQARDLRDRQGDRRGEEHVRDGRRLEQRYRPVGDARGVKQSATRLGGPSSKQKQGNSEARPLCLQEGAPAE